MIGRSTLLSIALALVAGIALFVVKYQVQTLESDLAGLRQQLEESREAVHVLHAEWTYLTDPQRLSKLAERHLPLEPMSQANIARIADLPLRQPDTEPGDTGPIAEGPAGTAAAYATAEGPAR